MQSISENKVFSEQEVRNFEYVHCETSASSKEDSQILYIPKETRFCSSLSSDELRARFLKNFEKLVQKGHEVRTTEFNQQSDDSSKFTEPSFSGFQTFKKRVNSFPNLRQCQPLQPINSEKEKFLKLIESENIGAYFNAKENVQNQNSISCHHKKLNLRKKILKSGMVRKVANFWKQKSLHFPVVFKRFCVEKNFEQSGLFEYHDLIKVQGSFEFK